MHGVWDDMIIDERGLSEMKYTDRLLKEIKTTIPRKTRAESRQRGPTFRTNTRWMRWSPNAANHAGYVTESAKIVDAQLALGSLRLARGDRILGEPDAPAGYESHSRSGLIYQPQRLKLLLCEL